MNGFVISKYLAPNIYKSCIHNKSIFWLTDENTFFLFILFGNKDNL